MSKKITQGDDPINVDNHTDGPYRSGLSKREYFAGLAMQALITNPDIVRPRDGENLSEELVSFSNIATEYADGLIKALNE